MSDNKKAEGGGPTKPSPIEKIKELKKHLPYLKKKAKIFLSGFFLVFLAISLLSYGSLVWIGQKLNSLDSQKITSSLQQVILKPICLEDFKIQSAQFQNKTWALRWKLVLQKLNVENFNSIHQGKIHSIEIESQPFHVLRGKLPVKIFINEAEFTLSSNHNPSNKGSPLKSIPIPFWFDRLNLDFHIENSKLIKSKNDSDPNEFLLSDLKGEVTQTGGLFGGVEGFISGDLTLKNGKALIFTGPIKNRFEGELVKDLNSIHGINLSLLEFDLSESSIQAFKLFRKPSDMLFEIRAPLDLTFSLEKGLENLSFEHIDLSIDKMKVKAQGHYFPGQATAIAFSMEKKEIEDLRIPLLGFENMPVNGIVHLSANFSQNKTLEKTANWKLTFNNLKIKATKLTHLIDESSSGEIILSLVNDGSYEKGELRSNNFEVNLKANEAQIEWNEQSIIKPKGNLFDFTLRSKISNNTWDIESIDGQLHTMTIKGNAKIQKLAELLKDEAALFEISINTNRIELGAWTYYLKAFRKQTLKGYLESAFSMNGKIDPTHSSNFFDDISWQISRLNLSRFNADYRSFEDPEAEPDAEKGFILDGPLKADFIFYGRGKGTFIENAELNASADLTDMNVRFGNFINKSAGTPLGLDFQLEQAKNTFHLKKGLIKLDQNFIESKGKLTPGTRSNSINVVMREALDLSSLNKYLKASSQSRMNGKIMWKGSLGFSKNLDINEALDLKDLTLLGQLEFSQIKGKPNFINFPLDNAMGTIQFEKNQITIPRFILASPDNLFELSGEISHRNRQSISLWQLLTNPQLKINSQISYSRMPKALSADYVNSTEPGKTLGIFIKEFVSKDWFKNSQIKSTFSLGPGRWNMWDLNFWRGRLEYADQQLRLDPFIFGFKKGRMEGNLTYDLSPYYLKNDLPTLSGEVKLLGVASDIFSNPNDEEGFWQDFKADLLNLRATYSTQGFDSNELHNNLRFRVEGDLEISQWDALNRFQEELKNLKNIPDVKDYWRSQNEVACSPSPKVPAKIDLSWGDEEARVGQLNIKNSFNSLVNLEGQWKRNGEFQLNGEFTPSFLCMEENLLKCVNSRMPERQWPLVFSYNKDPIFSQKILREAILLCTKNNIDQKIQNEIEQSSSSKENKKNSQEIKKILKEKKTQ